MSKAKKPLTTAKKAKPTVVKTAPKKTVTKPTAKKTVVSNKKKTVAAPKKTIATTKTKPISSNPKKTVAVAKKTSPKIAKTSKTPTPKLDGELFSALNNWKKKTDAKKQVTQSPKTSSKAFSYKKRTHTVKAGDTLYSLARKYNTKVEVIKKANKLSGNELKLGSRLIILP